MSEKLEIKLESSRQFNERVILVRVTYKQELIYIFKSIPGSRWSNSKKTWYIPEKDFDLDYFKKKVINWAYINSSKIRPGTLESAKLNIQILPDGYFELLQQKRYSESTIKTYTSYFRQFQDYFSAFDLKQISKDQINSYILELINERNISPSQQNQRINSIKFYYEKVLGRTKELFHVERPRKDRKLPTILSKEEVYRLLNQTKNLKHRSILTTIYSAGLRRSELIQLKLEDIDSQRKLIKIRSAKGNKDRYTLLSNTLIELLRKYYKEYIPVEWLFEGQYGGKYSATSIEKIFKAAVKRVGIIKPVTPHSLRHSFATHLLEQGTNLRYIQEILGHENPQTTQIYTHVATNEIGNIQNPLDDFEQFRI